jgi:UDP-galactopyranose mutase
MNFAIVGAGFSGAVLARELALKGHEITVFESRNHIAGNCHTKRDPELGIMIHTYGPHIFHTDNEVVWNYVNKFSEFVPYINRVKAIYKNQIYSLPINLHTINQFFQKTFNPKEAELFLNSIAKKDIQTPESFEEQALAFIGKDLYEAFFKEYTLKQWGKHPNQLPASILKRLPVRFNYDDNYFNHRFQGIPKEGYTSLVEMILNQPNITVNLNCLFEKNQKNNFDHVFYTGPIDGWFNYSQGRLGYRTLDFEREIHEGDFQGCAVMNYCEKETPYTRITEHKHFSPWEKNSKTIVFKEYSRHCEKDDIPFYPIRLLDEKEILYRYIELAKNEQKVSFLGRLGTYRYLDMDVTIAEALDAFDIINRKLKSNEEIPPFFINPL